MTMKEVKNKLHADSYSSKGGVFTVRKGYFYRMSRTGETFKNEVSENIPKANIIDYGDHWTSFKGGAPLAKSSHWYVKFTVDE